MSDEVSEFLPVELADVSGLAPVGLADVSGLAPVELADVSGLAPVELAEAIEAVRRQLIKAQEAGRKSGEALELGLVVRKVSMEFTGEVTKTGGVNAGVKFWVVTAGEKGDRVSGVTQKVTVELTPRGPGVAGDDVRGGVDASPSE